jgi:hypothetical protein
MEWKHVKYVVEIKRVLRCESTETKQFCTKETPTEYKSEGYGGRSEAAIAKEYEVRDVPKVETCDQSIFRQEVNQLDLVLVINAVNAKVESP